METTEGMKEYVGMVSQKNSWILNKDQGTFNDLIDGLVENKKSYGYQSCPCRLASGNRDLDRDLICPCDYAAEFVNVPERRPIEKEKAVLDHFNK